MQKQKQYRQQRHDCPDPTDPDGGDVEPYDIAVPIGVEVAPWGTIKDVVVQNPPSSGAQAGLVSVWVDQPTVEPARMQSIVGSLRAIQRYALNEIVRKGLTDQWVIYGQWDSATDGNIEAAQTNAGVPAQGSIGISIGLGFADSTLAFNSAVEVLIARLLELSKGE